MTEFASGVRRVLGVYQARTRDPDIEQAWLRIGICGLAFGYVCYLSYVEGQMSPGLWMGLVSSVGDTMVAAFMIWRLRTGTGNVVRLRYLGIFADNTALTIGMAGAGEGGVAMIGVYLWVTIGNGFRFGPRFLLASYWLSIAGFGLQLILVPFWEHHRVVGGGLFLAGAIVPLYVLVLLIRLTGQKEAAEQLSNAKSRFVANVSHELRTPLTGVFAVYDLLKLRSASTGERELIGILGTAIRTLKTSVDAVLQMSKLEAGAERAERRPFNLLLFVNQLSASVKPQSVTKGLDWRLSIDPFVPSNVVGDPSHLSHVLGNLLNNAFKFTTHGGVSLQVTQIGEFTRFEVKDSGIGIPADQQERLFERFVQVDGSAKRKFGGTGLGTSIARDLTELMGGRISVTSSPGSGSTFRVDLPLCSEWAPADSADWGRGRKVLLVGDGSSQCASVGHILSELELEVHVAPHHIDEKLLSASNYMATFLVMSAQDAERFCARYVGDRVDTSSPCVAVTPSSSPDERRSLARAGTACVLSSGPSINEVKRCLAHLLYRLEMPANDITSGAPDHVATHLPSRSILLADDNASNRMLISRILTQRGHVVREAGRGDEAFDLLATGNYDIALLDLNMPDMSGPDVIKLFRAASVGEAFRLPIIILSADATPAARQESLEAGADEFLTKPVTAEMLHSAVDRLVGNQAPKVKSQIEVREGAIDQVQSSGQLIDSDQLQSLRRIARGDEKFLEQYISAAFADLEAAVISLRAAASANNATDARGALHIIEGTGGSLGAVALVKSCKSMRTYVSVPGDPDCATALAELSTILALTKSAVAAVLHDLPRRPDVRVGSS